MAQRVIVMYAGEIVEQASVSELFAHPHHPYTEGLLAAMPTLGAAARPPGRHSGHGPATDPMAAGLPLSRSVSVRVGAAGA